MQTNDTRNTPDSARSECTNPGRAVAGVGGRCDPSQSRTHTHLVVTADRTTENTLTRFVING